MSSPSDGAAPPRTEVAIAVLLFLAAAGFHFRSALVGWESKNLPGVEFRQAQTALSAYFIQQEDNFSPAYPTPVLGKPWSVPMEFPLYQWTVVVVSNWTGLDLTKAGRVVSQACFYLMLPGVFLLLGRWAIPRGRRWVFLALILTCPLYIFYSRAFLIETMALMFSVWFWVACERAVTTRGTGWLAAAVVAGIGAGLVKVTTFGVYLLPVGLWAVARLWQGRKDGRWWSDLKWMGAPLVLPLVVAAWWVWYSDRIKSANPLADFITSWGLRKFNLGTLAMHFSGRLWSMKWRIISQELTWLPLLAAGLVLFVLPGQRRRREAIFCTAVFLTPVCAFPILYAYHDYYYLANTAALLLAMGLLAEGLTAHRRLRWAGWAAAVGMLVGQAYWYGKHYYPVQSAISYGGSGLTESLQTFTRPNDVVVIAGEDWSSIIPFFARRRALMLTDLTEHDLPRVDAALRELEGEKIGAFVVSGPWRERKEIIWRLGERGLAAEPWYRWHDTWVFLPERLRAGFIRRMGVQIFDQVEMTKMAELPPNSIGPGWHQMAGLPASKQRLFRAMTPTPVRFYNTFEPVFEDDGTTRLFGAHPLTRLVFHLAKGTHTLRTAVMFGAGAYLVPAGQEPTDGVEVSLNTVAPDEARHTIYRRLVNPTANLSERGPVPVQVQFTLERAGDVELVFGPGPKHRDTRDWIQVLGPLVFD